MRERALTHAFLITTEPGGLRSDDSRLAIGPIATKVVADFDFRAKSAAEIKALYSAEGFARRYGHAPTHGAVGCAAAHRHCYETLIGEGGSCALVMEDDVQARCDLWKLVSEVHSAGIEYDVLSLKITYGVFARSSVTETRFGPLRRATLSNFGAHAYLIHRDCARRFAALQRPSISHFADWPEETWQFRCYGLETDALELSGRQSTIQKDHEPERLHGKFGLSQWCWRLMVFRLMRIYRLKVCRDVALYPRSQQVARLSSEAA